MFISRRIAALAAVAMLAGALASCSGGGPDATALAPLVATALAQVRSGALTPARAWSRLLHRAPQG